MPRTRDTHVIPTGLVRQRIAQHQTSIAAARPAALAHAATRGSTTAPSQPARPASVAPPASAAQREQTHASPPVPTTPAPAAAQREQVHASAAPAQPVTQTQQVRASTTSSLAPPASQPAPAPPEVQRQPSETAASSRVPRDGEMKQAAREQKQKLQQALAAKKDLDAGGSQIAYRSALAKDGKMMFSRPYTAIAIPSPWGTKRNDGSVYKHKLKLFRKSNQEWVDTQKAAHTDADGVREPHAHVKELNSEAHKLGQEAASRRYAASAMSTVGDAAVATSTLTGGADGFTASIGTVSKLAAAATLRSAEVKSSLAEQKTADTLDKVRDNYLGANGVTEALTAIKDGHHAAQKSATRRKRAAIIQSVVQSTGLVGDHVGIASGSEAVLDSKGSAVRGQGVEGHAWTFGKPTAFTAAETGLDAAQDGGVATATGAYRPAKNHVVGGGNKSTAKRLQQEAAVKEMAAYQTIKEKGHHSFSGSNPMNPAARRPQPQHRDP